MGCFFKQNEKQLKIVTVNEEESLIIQDEEDPQNKREAMKRTRPTETRAT